MNLYECTNMNENKDYQKTGNRIAFILGCLLIIFSIFLLILMEKDKQKLNEMQTYYESLQEEIENYK